MASKTIAAVLAHMRAMPVGSEFLPLCKRDETAAQALVTQGLACRRTEARQEPYQHVLTFYRLLEK